jgi:hypothetical protein
MNSRTDVDDGTGATLERPGTAETQDPGDGEISVTVNAAPAGGGGRFWEL